MPGSILLKGYGANSISHPFDQTENPVHEIAAHHTPRSLSEQQVVIMQITIKASHVTQLRHLIMGACGDLVAFMRIQPIAHAAKMKIWLSLNKPAVAFVMNVVMRSLPCAEFGSVIRTRKTAE